MAYSILSQNKHENLVAHKEGRFCVELTEMSIKRLDEFVELKWESMSQHPNKMLSLSHIKGPYQS